MSDPELSQNQTKYMGNGITISLLSAGLFALSILSSKLVFQYEVGPLFFASARAVICILVCGAFIAITKERWSLPKAARPYILPMSGILVLISFGYPLAMRYIPASLATLLFYLWPLLVLLFTVIQSGTLPGIKRFAIFTIAFGGLALVFGASLDDLHWLGVGAAMTAAFGAGLYFMFIPRITVHANSLTINVYTNLISLIGLIAGAFYLDDISGPSAITGWYILGGAGILYGFAMIALIYAVKEAGPVKAAILFNTEPLIVTVLAALLLGEVLQPIQYAGIILVVGAMMAASARTAKS